MPTHYLHAALFFAQGLLLLALSVTTDAPSPIPAFELGLASL